MPIKMIPEKIQAAAVPFQLEDAARIVRRLKTVQGHKTGLGKTFITLLALSYVTGLERILVVGTGSAIGVWRRKFKEWHDIDGVVVKGNNDPEVNAAILNSKTSGVWLMTHATARMILGAKLTKRGQLPVDVLIMDEVHKYLRTRNKTWEAIRHVECKMFVALTATWASKGPQDLWPVLNLIDHKFFSSYWNFVNTWCYVDDSTWGKQILAPKNPDKLKHLLNSRYYTVRTWKEVGHQFVAEGFNSEPVIRRSELIDMSDQQAELYYALEDRMEARLGKEVVLAQNSLDKLTRLLQMAVSPKILFPEAEVGGPIEWLTEQLLGLESAVVFVPFKPLAQICADYLFANGYSRSIYRLQGGITTEVLEATIQAWKKTKGIVFCTISYAQSFELDISDYAYMLGFDWDPNNNIQAEGRLRRFDSAIKTPCLITYIVPAGTEYEKVKEVVNGRVDDVRKVLNGYGI